jgi:FKBP-type peptidyl-prolyl cis-trans isomerase FkpA
MIMSVTAVPLHPIKKGSVAKLWIALAALAALAAAFAWWGTSGHVYQTTPSGLQFMVLKEGKGNPPTDADVAFVTYTGRLADGTVFDSNVGQQPAPFPVAEGATIKGFSEALKRTRKGGKYRLRIPPQLGYGAKAVGPIPANATLDFEMEVLELMPEATLRQMMQQQGMGPGGPGGPVGQ